MKNFKSKILPLIFSFVVLFFCISEIYFNLHRISSIIWGIMGIASVGTMSILIIIETNQIKTKVIGYSIYFIVFVFLAVHDFFLEPSYIIYSILSSILAILFGVKIYNSYKTLKAEK